MRRSVALGALFLLAILSAGAARAQSFIYDGEALRDVIEDVERQTDWRFLYSDALAAGKHVRLRADAAALPEALARALAPRASALRPTASGGGSCWSPRRSRRRRNVTVSCAGAC